MNALCMILSILCLINAGARALQRETFLGFPGDPSYRVHFFPQPSWKIPQAFYARRIGDGWKPPSPEDDTGSLP